ncbi:VOC family protein [Streptomyces sp. HUAS ZL42]|uniref:VOC family protein n=1 Tax=Streptomyces sp. HUAS ZL42 TaxID=3231715 RepID=UPI00345E24FA
MELHVSHIVMDCADPERLAAFWSDFLGVQIKTRWRQYVLLEPSRDGASALAFQRVGEAKTGKNRAHVDLTVPDLEAATRHAVSFGAVVIDETTEDGVTVRVMADPEGNEFCLVRLPPHEGTSSQVTS